MRKRLRNRLGIAARRVAVQTHLPWPWRILSLCLLIAIGLLIILGGWRHITGRALSGDMCSNDTSDQQEQISALQASLAKARQAAIASEGRLRIDAAVQLQLTSQIKTLEEENARLKSDLAVFENLASRQMDSAQLVMSQLQVLPVAENAYRYRLTLAQGGGNRRQGQIGKLQFIATLQNGEKISTMRFTFSESGHAEQESVMVREFRRFDGVFNIPTGTRLTRLEAQFVRDGAIKASQVTVL